MDTKELNSLIDRISLTGPEGIKKIKKVLKEMSQVDKEGGNEGGNGGTSDYKIVRLLTNGTDGDSGYFESLADVIDTACSGKYVGGVFVSDAVGAEGTSGFRYTNITLCEYARSANGNPRVTIKDSDDYTLTIYDSPDLLRWLAGVSGDIMEQTDTPFAQYQDRYVKITMQGDIGAALEIGIEEERGGSKSVLLCDSDRYPYILEVTDGVITGISLFGQSTPENINNIVLLSMDKVSPLIGCEINISGTGIMNGGGGGTK